MSVVSELRDLFLRERRLAAQRSMLDEMREEVARQREQKERIRASLRRCSTCQYRQQALSLREEGQSGT